MMFARTCPFSLPLSLVLLVAGPAAGSASSATSPPGGLPLGWWRMDGPAEPGMEQGLEGAVRDDGWGAHDGQLLGDPELVPGFVEGGLALDGARDYVTVGDFPEYRIAGDLSLSAWVRVEPRDPPTLPHPAIIGKPRAFALRLRSASTRPELALHVPDAPEASHGYVTCAAREGLDTGWHHVAATYSRSRRVMRVYVDGELDRKCTVTSPTGQIVASGKALEIGRWRPNGDSLLHGTVDEVMLFDRVLSAAEVRARFEDPQNPPPPSAPQDLVAAVESPTSVRLSWREPTDAPPETMPDGFVLERKNARSNGAYRRLAILEPWELTFVDDGLEPGTAHVYRVRAFSAGGFSPYSAPAAAVTPGGEPTPRPLGWWTMDEIDEGDGSGGTVRDSGTGAHDGVLIGDPILVPGHSRRALSLDGVDDFVAVGDHRDHRIVGDLTISAWVRAPARDPESKPHPAILGKARGYALRLHSRSTRPELALHIPDAEGASHGYVTCAAPEELDGDWHHLAATYHQRAREMQVYVDGVRVKRCPVRSGSGDITVRGSALELGRWTPNGDSLLRAAIDEVRLWDRHLRPQELYRLYVESLLDTEPPPAGPDLRIETVEHAPPVPHPGDALVFSSLVANRGEAPTPPGVAIEVAWSVDGSPVGTGALSLPALDPGETAHVTQNGAWVATAGAHTVVAEVDPANAVRETDEDNNQGSLSFEVTVPVASELIGHQGGVLRSAASPSSEVVLGFPPGAVTSDTLITLHEIAGPAWATGPTFALGPAGIRFSQPVRVWYRHPALSPSLRLMITDGERWEVLEEQGHDLTGGWVSATVRHFSMLTLAETRDLAEYMFPRAICATGATGFPSDTVQLGDKNKVFRIYSGVESRDGSAPSGGPSFYMNKGETGQGYEEWRVGSDEIHILRDTTWSYEPSVDMICGVGETTRHRLNRQQCQQEPGPCAAVYQVDGAEVIKDEFAYTLYEDADGNPGAPWLKRFMPSDQGRDSYERRYLIRAKKFHDCQSCSIEFDTYTGNDGDGALNEVGEPVTRPIQVVHFGCWPTYQDGNRLTPALEVGSDGLPNPDAACGDDSFSDVVRVRRVPGGEGSPPAVEEFYYYQRGQGWVGFWELHSGALFPLQLRSARTGSDPLIRLACNRPFQVPAPETCEAAYGAEPAPPPPPLDPNAACLDMPQPEVATCVDDRLTRCRQGQAEACGDGCVPWSPGEDDFCAPDPGVCDGDGLTAPAGGGGGGEFGAAALPVGMVLRLPFDAGEEIKLLKTYGPRYGPNFWSPNGQDDSHCGDDQGCLTCSAAYCGDPANNCAHCRHTVLHKHISEDAKSNDYYALDLASAARADNGLGMPVVAAADGHVLFAGWVPRDSGWASYGQVVVLRHDHIASGRTLFSLYAHLNAVTVAAGQTLVRGAPIGTLGRSGDRVDDACLLPAEQCRLDSWDAAHLHFALYEETPENPVGLESPVVYGGRAVVPEPIDGHSCLAGLQAAGRTVKAGPIVPEGPAPGWVLAASDWNAGQVVGLYVVWEPVAGAETYEIRFLEDRQDESSQIGDVVVLPGLAVSGFVHTVGPQSSPEAQVNHCPQVRALGAESASGWVDANRCITPARGVPTRLVFHSKTVGPHPDPSSPDYPTAASVEWRMASNSAEAVGFDVLLLRDLRPYVQVGYEAVAIAAGLAGGSGPHAAVFTGLVQGESYCAVIFGVTAAGATSSVDDGAVDINCFAIAPSLSALAADVTVERSGSDLRVQWQNPDQHPGPWEIALVETPPTQLVETPLVAGTSFVYSGARPATDYCAQVRARQDLLAGAWWPQPQPVCTFSEPPDPPGWVAAATADIPGYHAMQLFWPPVPGAYRYEIQLHPEGSFDESQPFLVAFSGDNEQIVLPPAPTPVLCPYVRTIGLDGGVSDWSAVASARCLDPDASDAVFEGGPFSIIVEPRGADRLHLSFYRGLPAGSYDVVLLGCTDEDFWIPLAFRPGLVDSGTGRFQEFEIDGLEPGRSYRAYVAQYLGSVASGFNWSACSGPLE